MTFSDTYIETQAHSKSGPNTQQENSDPCTYIQQKCTTTSTENLPLFEFAYLENGKILPNVTAKYQILHTVPQKVSKTSPEISQKQMLSNEPIQSLQTHSKIAKSDPFLSVHPPAFTQQIPQKVSNNQQVDAISSLPNNEPKRKVSEELKFPNDSNCAGNGTFDSHRLFEEMYKLRQEWIEERRLWQEQFDRVSGKTEKIMACGSPSFDGSLSAESASDCNVKNLSMHEEAFPRKYDTRQSDFEILLRFARGAIQWKVSSQEAFRALLVSKNEDFAYKKCIEALEKHWLDFPSLEGLSSEQMRLVESADKSHLISHLAQRLEESCAEKQKLQDAYDLLERKFAANFDSQKERNHEVLSPILVCQSTTKSPKSKDETINPKKCENTKVTRAHLNEGQTWLCSQFKNRKNQRPVGTKTCANKPQMKRRVQPWIA